MRRRLGIPHWTNAKINGIHYLLDLNEYIDSDLYHRGSYEPSITKAIQTICGTGMNAFDIGANIGAHTFTIANRVGQTGKVVAVEPMSWAYRKLLKNLELNEFHNIVPAKVAFSNVTIQNFHVHFRTSWPKDKKSFRRNQAREAIDISAKPEMVDIYRLDDFVAKVGMDRVDFIKIDVDGYELKVFQGAMESLKRWQPDIITEIYAAYLERQGGSVLDLVGLMEGLGYHFFQVHEKRPYAGRNVLLEDLLNPSGPKNFILSVRPTLYTQNRSFHCEPKNN